MIHTLMLLAALSLTFEAVPNTTQKFQGIQATDVTFRNNSIKTVTAFRFRLYEGSSQEIDFAAVEGIAPGASYPKLILISDDRTLDLEVLGILYTDGSTEGPEASVLVASREGKAEAERLTARQVRTFLQFNTVFDDSAMAVLDRELEETLPVPRQWTTNHEKHSWSASYNTTRQSIRTQLKQAEHDHRRQQLESLGGRP